MAAVARYIELLIAIVIAAAGLMVISAQIRYWTWKLVERRQVSEMQRDQLWVATTAGLVLLGAIGIWLLVGRAAVAVGAMVERALS